LEDCIPAFRNSTLDNIPYGIYHCKIRGPQNKVFKFNNDDLYTHIDIRLARKNNMTITMLEGTNALIWSRDKLKTGKQLFGDYVDLLYRFKKKGVKGAKLLLNILWGALCETQKNKKSVSFNELTEIPRDNVINRISPCLINDGNTHVQLIEKETMFKTDYARMKPFLLAYSRENIIELYRPYKEHVKWVHTDGFILDTNIDIKVGQDIGDLDIEAEGQCHIVHLNKVKDPFGDKFSNK